MTDWKIQLNYSFSDKLTKEEKQIIENNVESLLNQQEKELIRQFTTHQRCTNCGKKKDRYSLSDWCGNCLEKE